MAFSWLSDYKKLQAGQKQKQNRVTVPDTLFGERYNPKAPTNEGGMEREIGGKQLSAGRYTGLGGDGQLQKDMPTGMKKYTEHEGEYVIPAATVDKLGGPENVDMVVEQLQMKSEEDKGGIAGYQDGGPVIDPAKLKETGAQLAGKELKMGDVKQPESASAQEFSGTFKRGLAMTESRAKGESPEMEKVAQMSRERLAGQQSAGAQAEGQRIAQTTKGAPSGAAAAQAALGQATRGAQTTELEQGIVETKVADMGNAQQQMVSAAMQGMSFEENKRQFGEQQAMQIEQFNENNRRYGMETAMNIEEKDWQRNQKAADLMIKSGDYENASKLLSARGINVDFTKLQDIDDQNKLNAALTNATANINSGFEFDNPIVQNNMKQMAEAQGMDWADPATQTWANKTYNSMTLASSPGYQVWGNMSDNDMTALFGPLDDIIDEKTGTSGKAAAQMKLTRASYTGGLTIDENGNVDIDDGTLGDIVTPAGADGTPGAPPAPAPAQGPTWNADTDMPFSGDAAKIAADPNHPQHEAVLTAQVDSMYEDDDFGPLKKAGKDSPLYSAALNNATAVTDDISEGWHGEGRDIDWNFKTSMKKGDTINFRGTLYTVQSGVNRHKHNRTWPRADFMEEQIQVYDPVTKKRTHLRATHEGIKVIGE